MRFPWILRRIRCMVTGHAPRPEFVAEKGDIVLTCTRCESVVKDSEVLYSEQIITGPPVERKGVKGPVKCTDCGYEWDSPHNCKEPVLCSNCRENRHKEAHKND